MQSILCGVLILLSITVNAQNRTEKITRELSFEKKGANNTLIVSNINGSIKVEGYTGETVRVEVQKTIISKTESRLDKGMKEVGLGVVDLADSIILYVNGICPAFRKNAVFRLGKGDDNNKSQTFRNRGWSYQWDECKNDKNEYEYRLDFVIKVPTGVHIDVSTINDGNISVANVTGEVKANNINGGIRLTDLVKSANATTINGDVDIDYSRNPDAACRFYTLNGNINANFKEGLSSNVSFKTFNGAFFTNLDKLTALPVEVEKLSSDKGTKYKVNGNRYMAGNGGPLLDFETFNGNVYLKEKK